jgi:hypothetical protein
MSYFLLRNRWFVFPIAALLLAVFIGMTLLDWGWWTVPVVLFFPYVVTILLTVAALSIAFVIALFKIIFYASQNTRRPS